MLNQAWNDESAIIHILNVSSEEAQCLQQLMFDCYFSVTTKMKCYTKQNGIAYIESLIL